MYASDFQGQFKDRFKHGADSDLVFSRAKGFGVRDMIFPSFSIEDAQKALKLSKKNSKAFITLGLHPSRGTDPFLQCEFQLKGSLIEQL
jgi:Tat protein secretion system quality control protein TatD with DNase activity